MKHETILVPVKCSERLPGQTGFYITDIVWYDSRPDTLYDKELNKWIIRRTGEEIHPNKWYEEQKDKIVLSKEELRDLVEYAVQQYDGLPIDEHAEKIIKEKL